MKEHFKLLGYEVRDVVTGFKGTVTTIAFDLYGCVQGYVSTRLTKGEKETSGQWFDLKRLVAVGKKPVMQVPTFVNVPGGQPKPAFSQLPPL
jgi:hypothetical protein